MPVLSRSLLASILTAKRPIIPQLIAITLPAIGIGIRTAIINTKTIIIGATAIAIDAEAIAVVIVRVTTGVTIGVIEIGEVITPLGDKKIKINIRIKGLKGTLV